MKTYRLITAIIILATSALHAQENQNIADLDFLFQSIKQLPSYKDQLKADAAYQRRYEELRKNLADNDNEFEVYQKLLQLIYPIKDNHLGLYRNPDTTYHFTYHKAAIDIDQQEENLKNAQLDSLEGYYTQLNSNGNFLIYKQQNNSYHAVNLKTGLLDAVITKTPFNSLDGIRFLNGPAPYVLYRNLKLSNGMLTGLNYFKKPQQAQLNIKDKGNYEYKAINDQVGYLRLSSFNSSDKNIKTATVFFAQHQFAINPFNLIVDLRNNGGGGPKTSGQFAKFLNAYRGKIYILQNSNTVSNAEQFIINLQGKKNITTLGETSRGTITYGSNYGKAIKLPSNRFVFYPTDMKGRVKDLAYESIGIAPNILLDAYGDDWIIQTCKYIGIKPPSLGS